MDNPFRVIAIISAFNEGDIISPVIGHLAENGVGVYLIDNHSTDDTIAQATPWLGRGLLQIEPFPSNLPAGSEARLPFDWTGILRRKEELASELGADWYIHHDADEIRESPWPGMTLKESIRWVDTLGYNCIDFRLLNFPPTDDEFKQGDDPRTYFRFYEEGAECDKVQLKCWKASKVPVSLAPHGGHEARFQGRRVFPIQFLLRHYPIRGQKHGVKKVFAERRNRLLQAEKSQGWHRQYDQIVDERHVFLRNAAELRPFDLDQARLELMLPDKILRSLGERVVTVDQEMSVVQAHRLGLMKHAVNLEKERDELKSHAGNLEREREELQKHAGNLEAERSELRAYAANLQTERDEFKSRTGNLQSEGDELRQHAANLQGEMGELRNHAGNLEREREELCRHVENLEKERDELKSHAGNLERARKELGLQAGNLEQARDQVQQRLVSLEQAHEVLKRHADDLEHESGELRLQLESLEKSRQDLERELSGLRNSRSWRWTAPLRRLLKD
jgi:uncharacterized coiled-coil DUF342 family protein